MALHGIGLAGCIVARPTTTPMGIVEVEQSAPPRSCLFVFLPGLGDYPSDYEKYGFADEVRSHGLDCDMKAIDAHFGYYAERSLPTRLFEDVLLPARERGYERIWLVGISMGGLGALMTAFRHPESVDGLIVLAPYLPNREITKEIARAGGLSRWSPPEAEPGDDIRKLWIWLRGYVEAPEARPPLFLGFGESDRRSKTHRILAEALPPDRTITRPGGHKWKVWQALFPEMLVRARRTIDASLQAAGSAESARSR